jgi:hypothetical protein
VTQQTRRPASQTVIASLAATDGDYTFRKSARRIVNIHVSAGTVVAHPGHQIVQARAGVGHELVAGVG